MSEGRNCTARRRKQRLGPQVLHVEPNDQTLLEPSAEKIIGLVEWFRPGEYGQVERVLADCRVLGVKALRTAVSWADWHTRAGQDWYAWLLPRLAAEVNLLPCFLYTPPSLGVGPKTAAPPRNPQAYGDFLDQMITLFGAYFEWVELWNEPNNLLGWDWRLDPKWRIFNEMIGRAAYWAQHCGKKTVLAGMCPTDPHWLALMCEGGVMQYIDVVGVHGFPGTWEFDWVDWPTTVARVQEVLDRYGAKSQV
jgi:CDP-paratose 2-epimerase